MLITSRRVPRHCASDGQDYYQRYTMPVFMQTQHTAGHVGREGPLELVRFAPAKNCAKGRCKEALQINRDLDNIKAQIIKHYQHLSDREAFVTAEMVRISYQGFGSEYETLLNFRMLYLS